MNFIATDLTRKSGHLLVILLLLFPWVSFGLNDMDSQPYYLVILTLYFLYTIYEQKPLWIWALFFVFLGACFVGVVFNHFDFTFIRSVLGYFSLLIVSNYIYMEKKRGTNFYKPVFVTCLVMFVVGVAQVFIDISLVEFLVHSRTTLDRGVTSLAPEPTYFAIFIIFASLILMAEKNESNAKSFSFIMLCNAISIFLLAQSSMGALFVILALFFWVLSSVKRSLVATLVCLMVVLSMSNWAELQGSSRMGHLVNVIMDEPLDVVEMDASINDRLKHVVYPIHGSFSDYFVPHGYHAFEAMTDSLNIAYNGFFWWGESSNTIMSGLGSVIFELGVVSLPLILWLMYFVWRASRVRDGAWISLSVIAFMFAAIPLSFTLFPMLITIMIMNSELKD